MVLQSPQSLRRRLCSITVYAALLAAGSCEKAPLLAPGGTVIYLTAGSSSVSAGGSVDIIAVLVEQGTASGGDDSSSTPASGTPVHNGTLVSFTSNIGRIEPAEAQTENGRAVVKFFGDGRSGTATILAYSGGARSEVEVAVGGAAAETITLTATPLSSTGGTSTVKATVQDVSGNPLQGVTVQFSATTGTLSSTSASTDASGIAQVTLSATSESSVTATVGSKTSSVTVTPATRSGLSITPPTTVTASSTAAFTVSVTSGANVKGVSLNWGDGTSTNLGAISSSTSAQHTYRRGGSYTVTATATMADDSVEPSVSTVVSVADFSVSISTSGATSADTAITFVAAVAPNTTNVKEYRWDFDNDGDTDRTTAGTNAQWVYGSTGTKTVKLTVVPVIGDSRSTTFTLVVS